MDFEKKFSDVMKELRKNINYHSRLEVIESNYFWLTSVEMEHLVLAYENINSEDQRIKDLKYELAFHQINHMEFNIRMKQILSKSPDKDK